MDWSHSRTGAKGPRPPLLKGVTQVIRRLGPLIEWAHWLARYIGLIHWPQRPPCWRPSSRGCIGTGYLMRVSLCADVSCDRASMCVALCCNTACIVQVRNPPDERLYDAYRLFCGTMCVCGRRIGWERLSFFVKKVSIIDQSLTPTEEPCILEIASMNSSDVALVSLNNTK